MTSFERAALGRPSTPPPPRVTSGSVTRSDATGVWVTADGADEAHPSGPCLGATRPVLTPEGTTVVMRQQLLTVGTRVAYASTPSGVWILSADLT